MSKATRRSRNPIKAPSEPAEAVSSLLPDSVLQKLPEDLRNSVIESASFSGPIPPPAMLGKYEEHLTGSAERIVRMAEKEQEHRHNWEDSVLASMDRDTKRSQWMGLFIFIAIILSSFILAMYDKVVPASVLGILGIIGVFGAAISLIVGRGDH